MTWELAPDLQKKVIEIISVLNLSYIDPKRVVVFRSFGSKSRAYARIWSFPKIWQIALELKPHYCIEVLSERFDKLNSRQQRKTLIHELAHIPKNFSGSLLHHGRMKKL